MMLSMDGREQVVVTAVEDGSEGDRAGLKSGDVMLEYDGIELKGSVLKLSSLASHSKGREGVALCVLRAGQRVGLSVRGGGHLGFVAKRERIGADGTTPRNYATNSIDSRKVISWVMLGVGILLLGASVGCFWYSSMLRSALSNPEVLARAMFSNDWASQLQEARLKTELLHQGGLVAVVIGGILTTVGLVGIMRR